MRCNDYSQVGIRETIRRLWSEHQPGLTKCFTPNRLRQSQTFSVSDLKYTGPSNLILKLVNFILTERKPVSMLMERSSCCTEATSVPAAKDSAESRNVATTNAAAWRLAIVEGGQHLLV